MDEIDLNRIYLVVVEIENIRAIPEASEIIFSNERAQR
jgi:hypothetical protein